MKSIPVFLTAIGVIVTAQNVDCFPATGTVSAKTAFYVLSQARNIADSLETYIGNYEIGPGERLTVSLSNGTLYILPPGETNKTELKPVKNSEFEVVNESAKLFFRKDQAGNVTQVEIRFGNGATTTAKKL